MANEEKNVLDTEVVEQEVVTEATQEETVVEEQPAVETEVNCEVEFEENSCACTKKAQNKFLTAVDNFFGITKSGSNFKTEIIAGITTFMAMAYILIVNPDIMSAAWAGTNSKIVGALYIATCLGAIIGTTMMALHAKMPFALAPGMGLNAYFAFSIVLGSGGKITPANGLFIILLSGILFLVLTLVGVREKIVDAIPDAVKQAIPAGIGLFIAFIGLQNSKIIVGNGATLVAMANLNFLKVPFTLLFPMIVTFVAFMLIAVLSKLKIKGAILWGILGGTALHYIMGYAGGFFTGTDAQVAAMNAFLGENMGVDELFGWFVSSGHTGSLAPSFTNMDLNPFHAFAAWGTELVGIVFTEGWDFGGMGVGAAIGVVVSAILAFAMVDMFDTIGTLIGTAKKADMLDEDGKLPNMKKALLSDSVATCTGAICGTTTVTTFVESSAGVAEGGRTGLTSLVVAFLFVIALFASPLAYLIPSSATAAALIYVGVLMMSPVKDIDFSDVAVAVPAFLTISMMAFTYNISFGIGLGLISHCIIQLCTGKYFKKVDGKLVYLKQDILTMIIAVLFICNFIFVTH